MEKLDLYNLLNSYTAFSKGTGSRYGENRLSSTLFQLVGAAGATAALRCAGFPKVGSLEQSSPEVCQADRWCRCLCCFLWNQPVGVGPAVPGANLCIPSPAKEQSRASGASSGIPLMGRETRMQESNGETVCRKGVYSGP